MRSKPRGTRSSRLPYSDPYQLGAEFFRWEFATAVAGHVLGINPFDQPNVQEAKDATAENPRRREAVDDGPTRSVVLAQVRPGRLHRDHAYLPRNAGTIAALDGVVSRFATATRWRRRSASGRASCTRPASCIRAAANNGVFMQVVGENNVDVAIPGQKFTFGELKAAQALGDLASLKAHGRRVARVTLAELEGAAGAIAPPVKTSVAWGDVAGSTSVEDWLRGRPTIAALLEDAMLHLRGLVPDARFSLKMLDEPDDEPDQLFLGVVTSLPEQDARSALRRFDQKWWLANVHRAGGQLCIDLE